MSIQPSSPASVTGLHTRSTYSPDYAALSRHRLSSARSSAGLSPAEFAERLARLLRRPIDPGHIVAWETTTTPPGDVVLAAMSLAPSASGGLSVRSHKFIAAHVGYAAAQKVIESGKLLSATGHLECWTTSIGDAPGHCDMYIWPNGTVLHHLVEELDLADVTSLALWRYQSYPQNLQWASTRLRQLVGDDQVAASYVLSAYWVHNAPWVGGALDSALRLICSPRVLVNRDLRDVEASQVSGERVEQQLIAEGFNPPDMRSFGVKGSSSAFASWSGVVYHTHDLDRGLTEHDLVTFELNLQAIWSYTAYINNQIEHGANPAIGPRHGYAFLRAARSRMLTSRPQETSEHAGMRSAIVETSGLPSQLALAMEALKEMGSR